MDMKTSSEMFCNDDFWCLTRINSVASDDFPVEELLNLDFPEVEFQDGCEDEVSDKGNSNISSSSSSSSSSFSGIDEFDSLSAGELAVPADGLEDLEWLSQFVDDSTSEVSLLCPTGSLTVKTAANTGNLAGAVNGPSQKISAPCFPFTVPSRARSKRPRSSGRPWFVLLLSVADFLLMLSSSNGSSALSPYAATNAELFSSVEKPPAKKQKIKPEGETGPIPGRRCTHCQVQKTPQWRAGPLGPKTLCNACGVRFKSGRLFPEYRPACSPTFSQDVHSNSHRKVLEMRRKKEMNCPEEPGMNQGVQSQSVYV
jgi:hypothetical protein